MKRESGGIKSVLHVLPHPGGGGETYVDALARMDGYRFDRVYLAPTPSPRAALRVLPRSGFGVARAARSHDLLHVHGEVASAICLPLLAVRRSVVTLHGLHLLRRADGAALRVARANLRLVVAAAGRTICVSEAERVDALDVIGARAGRRLVVIHNGVDPLEPASAEERAAARAELGIAPGTTVGVYLGSLDEHKDPLAAARATAEVARAGAPIALLVAGDGPLRPDLERLAGEAGGGTIHVLGHRTDVRHVLAAADFFVLPSHREGFSYALLEAMSLGLAPVVSDAPGNPEAVGDTGIVVRRGDVEGFADAFRRVLDEGERGALGERARERVARCFTAEAAARQTREVYDEVLGIAGPAQPA